MAMYDFARHLLFLSNGDSIRLPEGLMCSGDSQSAEAVKEWASSCGLIKNSDDLVTLI